MQPLSGQNEESDTKIQVVAVSNVVECEICSGIISDDAGCVARRPTVTSDRSHRAERLALTSQIDTKQTLAIIIIFQQLVCIDSINVKENTMLCDVEKGFRKRLAISTE